MDNPGNYPGGSTYNASSSNKKLQQTQAQVDEVVGIMRLNVEKVLERDQKLSELSEHAGINIIEIKVVGIMRDNVAKVLERDEKLSELGHRADNLQVGASQFEQQASRLKRKYWWKNLKMMIIIGVICAVLLIIILVSIFSGGDGGSSDSSTTDNKSINPPSNPATPAPGK